jgi:hypothetical protein
VAAGVRDTEVTVEAIRLENGSNPSVCLRKARRALGQPGAAAPAQRKRAA